MSPQRIFCSKCGELLYTGVELETPNETIQRNGGYCPKCGKKLGFETETLKISPATAAATAQTAPQTPPQ